ncbi:hypothetical protein FSP39_024122 [Pinctada imbricata]|uniref:G-protein coupled receptors family 1 profile domain-containing protein n=1 Tax=Pinctada imbricata TaxID=66713 RepID=A0AA88YFJ3_PINIB|nr:hypothetical protein FSP39_024122 [Pinctada imbricata]
MSNSSTGTSGDALTAFSDSYFQWLENDVFPIIIGIGLLIILLLGTTLNAVMIHAFVKKRVKILSSTILFWQLVVIDFVAYTFVIFPGIISSFANKWILSDGFCTFQGVVHSLCFLTTFIFLTILCVEKSVNLFNSNVHSATFENKKICITFCVLTWTFGLLGSLMPAFGWGVIEYITYELKCAIAHSKNRTGMILYYLFGLFLPLLVTMWFSITALCKRKELLHSLKPLDRRVEAINDRIENENGNIEIQDLVTERSVSADTKTTDGRTLTSTDIEVRPPSGNRVSPEADTIVPTSPPTTRSEKELQRDIIVNGASKNKKALNAMNVALSVFSSSVEHNHFHFAMTFTLMWLTALFLWCPYVILLFIDIFDVASVWNGWFSIAGFLCDVTYCIKPIVFLSHNRQFRKAATKSMPERLRKRATRAAKVLQKTMKRMDEVVFVRVTDYTERMVVENAGTNNKHIETVDKNQREDCKSPLSMVDVE